MLPGSATRLPKHDDERCEEPHCAAPRSGEAQRDPQEQDGSQAPEPTGRTPIRDCDLQD